MTPQLWAAVAPLLTVYGSGKLNMNTADGDVLGALGFSAEGIRAIRTYRVGEDGQEGTADDASFASANAVVSDLETSLPSQDLGLLSTLLRAGFLGVRSEAFRVTITATVPGSKSPVRVSCVMNRSGRIDAWREE